MFHPHLENRAEKCSCGHGRGCPGDELRRGGDPLQHQTQCMSTLQRAAGSNINMSCGTGTNLTVTSAGCVLW